MYIMCVNAISIGVVKRFLYRYTERLLMCASRPGLSIRGLFGKACSPTMGKA